MGSSPRNRDHSRPLVLPVRNNLGTHRPPRPRTRGKMTAEHVAPEDAKWITPADELDDIELGWRVSLWYIHWQFGQLYTYEEDRIKAATFYFVLAVASVTSHRGHPYPGAWWPPSAGPRET